MNDFEDLAPDVDERVRATLRVDAAMPADVWARLAAALEAEAASPAGVAVLPPPTPLRARRTAWLPALAAAAAVLVIAGLVLPGMLRGPDPAPVAAPPADSAAATALDAAPEAFAAGTSRGAPPEELPARQVLASGARYDTAGLDRQVVQLLDTIGASNATLMASVQPDSTPTEGTAGFTASLEGLRECLETLTAAPQALVIDRASYRGSDAAVVVLPPQGASPEIEVFVVGPGCSHADPAIRAHSFVRLRGGPAE